MKAKPMALVPGLGYAECEAHEATHLRIRIPGPTGMLTLPVLQGNATRAGTSCWTWNGSTDALAKELNLSQFAVWSVRKAGAVHTPHLAQASVFTWRPGASA